MNTWRQFPLLRLIFIYITGIFTGYYLPCSGTLVLPAIAFLYFCFLLVVIFSIRLISFNYRYVPGSLITLLAFGIAYQITVHENRINSTKNIGSAKALYIADITEPVTQKPGTVKCILRLESVKIRNRWVKTTGKILVYFQKDGKTKNLDYGDRIIFYTSVKEPPGPVNPYSYDYRRFLKIGRASCRERV